MRQDGPHERFCSFLSAKMEPQDAPKSMENLPKKYQKSSCKKQCRKILGTRKTGRESTMQARAPGPPTPSILASPGNIPLISLKYQASSSEVNFLRFRPLSYSTVYYCTVLYSTVHPSISLNKSSFKCIYIYI